VSKYQRFARTKKPQAGSQKNPKDNQPTIAYKDAAPNQLKGRFDEKEKDRETFGKKALINSKTTTA